MFRGMIKFGFIDIYISEIVNVFGINGMGVGNLKLLNVNWICSFFLIIKLFNNSNNNYYY